MDEEHQLQIPQVKRPRKTKKPKHRDGLKTEAIKPKREHIMTDLRIEAFKKCQEARRKILEAKKNALSEALQAKTTTPSPHPPLPPDSPEESDDASEPSAPIGQS
jgi:hypothetical protein